MNLFKVINKMRVTRAHKFSSYHRISLMNDSVCGCFYCLKIFSPKEIVEWWDDEKTGTAVCPYCCIDAIIGESSGYPITTEFLKAMNVRWFNH